MENPKKRVYRSNKIDKMSEISTYERDPHLIYTSMVCMSKNAVSPRRNYGDSSQLTNWILDSGETCHMTPELFHFIPVSLV